MDHLASEVYVVSVPQLLSFAAHSSRSYSTIPRAYLVRYIHHNEECVEVDILSDCLDYIHASFAPSNIPKSCLGLFTSLNIRRHLFILKPYRWICCELAF